MNDEKRQMTDDRRRKTKDSGQWAVGSGQRTQPVACKSANFMIKFIHDANKKRKKREQARKMSMSDEPYHVY